ncbi:MAG: homoserine dehydrogenase [Gemmatimonadetes bacterium]|nr:homoserine dehydrogenase [Gemmatimonadota bacterium]
MAKRGVSVVKFGSSVLRDERDLPRAVLDIYRDWRRGYDVVAVVSAFAGTTDRLLEDALRHWGNPEARALARLLATGESVAAATLGLQLDECGIPHTVLDPQQVGLRTCGNVLDAEPRALDAAVVHRALAETGIVVLPGFAGCDADGMTNLLGRGGSDLTALFLAQQLGAASCRMVKDVEGLHPHDPHGGTPSTQPYATASWAEALRVGRALVQPKAMEFAQRHRVRFAIGAPGSANGTKVGPYETRLRAEASRPRVRVALAGLGTVGLGVYRWLRRYPEQFEVVCILVEQAGKPRPNDVDGALLTTDPWALLNDDADVLVELIGGTDTAKSLLDHAITSGIDVVTANKALLASNLHYLQRGVVSDEPRVRCSASVGGAVPVLEGLVEAARHSRIDRIEGVLNGTCNYVLDRVVNGCDFDLAVREAQEKGIAERDPSLDLSGRDSASKLAVAAFIALGVQLDPDTIDRQGIDQLPPERIARAANEGKVLRLVAQLERTETGWHARVHPVELSPEHALARTRGEENAVVVYGGGASARVLRGKGAGRWPTTTSVLADLLDLHRARSRAHRVRSHPFRSDSIGSARPALRAGR